MSMIMAENIATFPNNYSITEIRAAIAFCLRCRETRNGYFKQKAEQIQLKLASYCSNEAAA